MAKQRSYGHSRFFRFIKRNSGEKVVDDMVINNVVKEMPANKPVTAVYRAERAFGKCPTLVRIVRN